MARGLAAKFQGRWWLFKKHFLYLISHLFYHSLLCSNSKGYDYYSRHQWKPDDFFRNSVMTLDHTLYLWKCFVYSLYYCSIIFPNCTILLSPLWDLKSKSVLQALRPAEYCNHLKCLPNCLVHFYIWDISIEVINIFFSTNGC